MDNYDSKPSVRIDGTGNDKALYKWIDAPTMAYICDQMDECPGFVKRKDNRAPVNGVTGGGWMRGGNFKSETPDGTYDSWKKKGSVQKASDHKPNEPSVLANPATKVSFFDGGNFEPTEWKHVRGFVNGSFGGEDRTASIKIPLGYKFIGFQHYMDKNTGNEGAGNTTGIHLGPKKINGSELSSWGMLDNMSSFIIEQVPFDVNTYFDTMTNSDNMIDQTDASAIKAAWCKTPTGIQSDKCINAGLARSCPAETKTCYAAATDITCPAGYTKDVPNNTCNAGTGTVTAIDCSQFTGYEADLTAKNCRARAVSTTDLTCNAGYSKDLVNNKCKAITGTVATVTGCPAAYNADAPTNKCKAKTASIASLTCSNGEYFKKGTGASSNKCVPWA